MSSSIFTARRDYGRDQSSRQSQHNRRHATKKDTLKEILSLKKSAADAIVVSPTVSMHPKALFDIDRRELCGRHLYYVHGRAFRRDRAGGLGVSFFGKFAEKFVMSRESQHSKI